MFKSLGLSIPVAYLLNKRIESDEAQSAQKCLGGVCRADDRTPTAWKTEHPQLGLLKVVGGEKKPVHLPSSLALKGVGFNGAVNEVHDIPLSQHSA